MVTSYTFVFLFAISLVAAGIFALRHMKAQMHAPQTNQPCPAPRARELKIDAEDTSRRLEMIKREIECRRC